MPISVTCPNPKCMTRFTVADQHAGKTGACPKCKGPIKIPDKADEIIIHAPDSEAGAKDATGRNVLKPIKRKETKVRLNTVLIIVGGVLLTTALAFLIGRHKADLGDSFGYVLALGAVLVGPPLALAGYTFLRSDEELEPFRGTELAIRCLACGIGFAAMWGIYWYIGSTIFEVDDYNAGKLEIFQVGILVLLAIAGGTGVAFLSFDFDPPIAFFHFALYFGATILLRVVMGMHQIIPGIGGA